MPIPLIDIFAGPGGLGEGFSRVRTARGRPAFRIGLSIEKDKLARETLKLRSFVRAFENGPPPEYYDFVALPEIPLSERLAALYEQYPRQAKISEIEAWRAELGKTDSAEVHARIREAIGKNENWVLIGGPPCQAYSLVGRSRNAGKDGYVAEEDERQYLYLEYLQVLAEHSPAAFVMENVKGILSATLESQRIFDKILDDLSRPEEALRREGREIRRERKTPAPKYRLVSVVKESDLAGQKVTDFLVRMENYGVPQTRHRVVVLGIREDLIVRSIPLLEVKERVPIRSVLCDLPALRSGLSRQFDDLESWRKLLGKALDRRWLSSAVKKNGPRLKSEVDRAITIASNSTLSTGGEYLPVTSLCRFRSDWYGDAKLKGILHHRSKSHMDKDIHRYLFASAFAAAEGHTPDLEDFPADLLPEHANIEKALNVGHFADRFRVQGWEHPASTITSHIAKDGHYFIHPDPSQCRALTAREAARIQTFPDNYFFCGSRTAQYMQIGNAVPPILASEVGKIVAKILG